MILNWFELSRNLNKINEKFNAWTSKFTDNGMLATVVVLVAFLLLILLVGGMLKKQK